MWAIQKYLMYLCFTASLIDIPLVVKINYSWKYARNAASLRCRIWSATGRCQFCHSACIRNL